MSDFEKIKKYYNEFDEKNRLSRDSSGKLEYDMTKKILEKYLQKESTILDLGGGAGVYTMMLAEKNHKMYLADLSEKLINEAKQVVHEKSLKNVISCDVVNAIDLSKYQDEMFDAIILFGPLYHLTNSEERKKCVQEITRVLKKDGLVFASFIPYLSGSIAIVDRYFRHPEQVNSNNLIKVFETGIFNSNSDTGFQEGYYPSAQEVIKLFEKDFEKIEVRSIRGFGYEREEQIYNIQNKEMYENIINMIEKTARQKEIVETCGHAMYIGKKK